MIEIKEQKADLGISLENSVATASIPVMPITTLPITRVFENAILPKIPGKTEKVFYNPYPLDEPFKEPKGSLYKIGRVLTSPVEISARILSKVGEALSGVFNFLTNLF